MDIASATDRLLNWIFPHQCPLCREPSQRFLCPACHRDLPVVGRCCTLCSLPLYSDDVSVCGECQRQRPTFDKVIAAFSFEPPVDHFVNRFKHRGRFDSLPLMVEILAHRISSESELPDLITPVPLHWTTLLRRGFNQSEVIARQLARQTSVPYRRVVLKRMRTAKQQSLTRRERLRNLDRAFQLRADLEGKHVAMVDDVVTTGATAETLARLLKRHGARRVDVWALARTPK